MSFLKLSNGVTINLFQVAQFTDTGKSIEVHLAVGNMNYSTIVVVDETDMKNFRWVISKHPAV